MAHPYASKMQGGARAEAMYRAAGGAVKGGSPTSSKTATKTSTKTSTVANPKGNVTVTGGAGDGDTHVIIGDGKLKGKVK